MARSLKDIGKYKRSGKGRIYQPSTQTEFKKVAPGKWEMIPDTEVLKWFKQAEQRITSRRNKGAFKGVNFSKELNQLRHARKNYLQSIKDFNEGKIKRTLTVGRREKALVDKAISIQHVFSKENKEKLVKNVHINNKIAHSRMLGRDNVYNDKLYDEAVADAMKTLGCTREEAIGYLFPSGFDEMSSYEEFKKNKENKKASIQDILNQRVKDGTITATDKDNFNMRWRLT